MNNKLKSINSTTVTVINDNDIYLSHRKVNIDYYGKSVIFFQLNKRERNVSTYTLISQTYNILN